MLRNRFVYHVYSCLQGAWQGDEAIFFNRWNVFVSAAFYNFHIGKMCISKESVLHDCKFNIHAKAIRYKRLVGWHTGQPQLACIEIRMMY